MNTPNKQEELIKEILNKVANQKGYSWLEAIKECIKEGKALALADVMKIIDGTNPDYFRIQGARAYQKELKAKLQEIK